MTPGLAGGPPFPQGAKKGSLAAIASTERPTVPVAVGVCVIDVSSLGRTQGSKGHAVQILHWAGDELWAWSATGKPGGSTPEYLDGWMIGRETGEGGDDNDGQDGDGGDESGGMLAKGVSGVKIDDERDDRNGDGLREDGGVSLAGSRNGKHKGKSKVAPEDEEDEDEEDDENRAPVEEREREMTTKGKRATTILSLLACSTKYCSRS